MTTDRETAELREQCAAYDAAREARARRHWDHTEIRPARDRNGEPAAELLFYSAPDTGMISVIPATDAELAELAAQIEHYLNVKAITAAEAEAEARWETAGTLRGNYVTCVNTWPSPASGEQS
jgi:hypothetical protein